MKKQNWNTLGREETKSRDKKRLEMPPKVEATIMLQKCPSNKKLLGVRIQKKSDGKWYTVWNFPIDDNRAKSENYGSDTIKGDVYTDDEYAGCPYCGARYFVQCGQCKKITCLKGNEPVTCAWCGNYMTNFSYGTLDLRGGDI